MIVRVIAGLLGLAVVASVRGLRGRARRAASAVPSLTMRSAFTGLENPIYRVLIDHGGPPGEATFTWSRDGERRTGGQNVPVQCGTWIALDNGIDVRFDGGDDFATSDFWTFFARSAADTVTLQARRRGSKRGAHARAKRAR